MFTAEEIDLYGADAKSWHEFVRRREAEETLASYSEQGFRSGLEIGAGDGGQSVVLGKYCRRLICTELDAQSHAWLGQTILQRNIPNVEYRICDAQDLSDFADESFDLVFSSNVLEHIPDLDRCLSECRRVLARDGVMLHTMPSRWWKIFKVLISFLRFQRPRVHGVSKSHWKEFVSFGMNNWITQFRRQNLEVEEVRALPFYFGHGPRFRSLIKLGNHFGWPGSYLYVVRKTSAA
jgi:ubiquinone/menaquinone biosynthesis C-methylase UbiE